MVSHPIFQLYPRPPPIVKQNFAKFLRGCYAPAGLPLSAPVMKLASMLRMQRSSFNCLLGSSPSRSIGPRLYVLLL